MATIPRTEVNVYNQKVLGVFGEFGSGGNTKISFLQTGIKPIQLEKIKLISEIRGSEKWSVRDLFQREVNDERITNEILPYIQDDNKVKFFNPLTITLLPIEGIGEGTEISEIIPEMTDFEETDPEGYNWKGYKANNFYKFGHIRDQHEYGYVEWNEEKVRAVAIDGQHRLSALKRCSADPAFGNEFSNWTIPVVIFSLRSLGNLATGNTILSVVRNIFIYINTQAIKPSANREIILSDESVNAICAQELLEYSHTNDVREEQDRDDSKTPLLFYGWRDLANSAAYVKSIEEIKNWLESYILGVDFSDQQKVALGINPTNPLSEAFLSQTVTSSSSKAIRQLFQNNILPGIAYLMENFIPYQRYSNLLRELEVEMLERSDLARHAFSKLRFGHHQAPAAQEADVEEIYNEIIQEHILEYKENEIPDLLELEIGMRGVICAFSEVRPYYFQSADDNPTYLDYAKWFTNVINIVCTEDWFNGDDNEIQNLLLHVSHNENETVVNYRFQDVKRALGPFITLLVGAYGRKNTNYPKPQVWQQIQEEYMQDLEDCLRRGYKKEARTVLRTEFPVGPQLNEAVNRRAEDSTTGHIERMQNRLNSITG